MGVEILDNIIELRHIETLLSSFINEEVEDGRVYTSFSLVETGRLSSHEDETGKGTHLQNIPPSVRKMFVADEGMILVEADKKQGEAMIVAWLAEEEKLKEAFKRGEDIHEFNAKNLGKDRKYAKSRTHGWNYLLGAVKPKKVITEDCEAREKYFRTYPKIKLWQDKVIKEVYKTRRLINSFGRRRMFFERAEYEKDKSIKIGALAREAVAFLGQSTLVDDVNRSMIQIFYMGEPRIQLLHQGHDSLLWQLSESDLEWGVKLIKENFELPFICGGDILKIPVEVKKGRSWGEMEIIE